MKKLTIAIDGYSSCGKSTLAKAIAQEMNYVFIDSGAMYRGVSLFAVRNEWVKNGEVNADEIIANLDLIKIHFELNSETNKPELILNDENVEHEIRTLTISNVVSKIARIKEVRQKMVALQRSLGEQGGVVMDGRDIGSVVFPNAELKIFVTADPKVRAERRFKELTERGDQITFEEVSTNLKQRDETDTNRKESPLIKTSDARTLDNTFLNKQEQLEVVLKWIEQLKA
ncbi:MAG: (d)CMP kinase [Lishizhenia sp.]